MAFQFDTGIFSIEGLSGEILPGTKLFWYTSGTSTPLATYSDPGLSVPNANPVLSAADGRLPAIWLQEEGYKLVVVLPDGTTFTRDPIRNPGSGVFPTLGELASDEGAGLIGFSHDVTYPAGTVGATIAVNIKNKPFSAKMDGDPSDLDAFNDAIAYLNGVGGGTLMIPEGTLNLGTGAVVNGNNIRIEGACIGATVIEGNSATADILSIGNGVSNPNNIEILNLSFRNTVAKTDGSAIRFRNGHNLRAHHVRFDDNINVSMTFDGGAQQFNYYFHDFEINSGKHGMVLGSDGTLPQNIYFGKGGIANTTDAAILLIHASGVYGNLGTIDTINCKHGVKFFPGPGQNILAAWLNNILADTCSDHGWWITTNGGEIRDVNIVAPWASTCQGHGMYVDEGIGNIQTLTISRPKCPANYKNGMRIVKGKTISIDTPVVTDNSREASAAWAGIYIDSGNTDGVSIDKGVCGEGGVLALPNQQSYGIEVQGSGGYVEIDGTDCRGNLTNPVRFDPVTGTTRVVGVKGYPTAYRGSGVILAGQTSATVPHNLAIPPAVSNVMISDTTSRASVGINSVWVSGVSGSNVTISCNAAPSANFFFAIDARILGA